MDDLYGPRGRYFRRDSHRIAHAAACEYPQARGSSGSSTTHRKPVIESSLSQSSMQTEAVLGPGRGGVRTRSGG